MFCTQPTQHTFVGAGFFDLIMYCAKLADNNIILLRIQRVEKFDFELL